MLSRKQIHFISLIMPFSLLLLSHGFHSIPNNIESTVKTNNMTFAQTTSRQNTATSSSVQPSSSIQHVQTSEEPRPDITLVSRGDERQFPKRTPSGELILEKGVTDEQVTKLQKDLQQLGYFNAEPTGFFGDITEAAVIKFQKQYSLFPDGQAGLETIAKIQEVLKNPPQNQSQSTIVSQPEIAASKPVKGNIQLLPWFGSVENIFSIGTIAVVTDIDSGLSFKVKRTYGYNHADVETLTPNDTEILKKVAGGYWNWIRRAAIVEIDGYRIAASITAMPHAGRDDQPANIYVNNRSGDYGYGVNLDTIKGNNMDGHFDIHFFGSRTHGTNQVDSAHQQMVQKAYKYGQ